MAPATVAKKRTEQQELRKRTWEAKTLKENSTGLHSKPEFMKTLGQYKLKWRHHFTEGLHCQALSFQLLTLE